MADQLNAQSGKKTLDRSILTACLIYPMLEKEIQAQYLKNGLVPHFGEILLLTTSLIKAVLTSSFSHFPKRLSMMMGFILSTQYRLTPLSGKRHHRPKLLYNREFEFALRFLQIRSMVDEQLVEDYNWWHHMYRQIERQSDRRRHHPHEPPHHHEHDNQEVM